MTIIYSMEYEKQNTMDSLRAETKLGLSWEQVGTKLGLSWDEVEKIFDSNVNQASSGLFYFLSLRISYCPYWRKPLRGFAPIRV